MTDQAYSSELRRDVRAASAAGASTQEVAVELAVSKSWVRRVKQEWREQGQTAPKTTRDRPQEWERHADWIQAKVEAQPDLDLRELQTAAEELGWATCDRTFVRAGRALGLTRKQRRGSPPSGTASTWRSPGKSGWPVGRTSIPTGWPLHPGTRARRDLGEDEHDPPA